MVPWAGEFAGKYLISGVQALRMSDDPNLRATLTNFVAHLIALQDRTDISVHGPCPSGSPGIGICGATTTSCLAS